MGPAKLRHIAIATKDPETTASFYKDAFGLEEVGRVDAELASGIYLSDGTINVAVLDFKTDQLGRGLDYTGLHHIGFIVDDLQEAGQVLQEKGALPFADQPSTPGHYFEVKHRGPDGVVIDIADHLWSGASL